MSATVPELSGLTLSRISDLGVQLLDVDETPAKRAQKKMSDHKREKHP
jgi:hypothetical protein